MLCGRDVVGRARRAAEGMKVSAQIANAQGLSKIGEVILLLKTLRRRNSGGIGS